MNYQFQYNKIIIKARLENRIKLNKKDINYIYYENHHIIPKCIDGNEDKNNKILLTAKEHYICHKLLTYIYKANRKITCAFHYMTFDKKSKHHISSRDYAYARELLSLTPMSEETKKKLNHEGEKNPMFGKHQKQESKIKQSKKMKGRKISEEHKNKVKKANIGKIRTNEMKKKMSIAKTGENNFMYRKTIYDVWLQKYGKEEANNRWENWLTNVRNGVLRREQNKNKQII